MKQIHWLFIMTLMSGSCGIWKSNLYKEGGHEQSIENAIYDFANTTMFFKKDSVFSISFNAAQDSILTVSILGATNKLYPTPNNNLGSSIPYFPTRYKEFENKLFVWYDSNYVVTKEIFQILDRYNHIDTVNLHGIVRIPDSTIEDSKQGVDYYFCKCDLSRYKKVKISIAVGYYEPPTLSCEKKCSD